MRHKRERVVALPVSKLLGKDALVVVEIKKRKVVGWRVEVRLAHHKAAGTTPRRHEKAAALVEANTRLTEAQLALL